MKYNSNGVRTGIFSATLAYSDSFIRSLFLFTRLIFQTKQDQSVFLKKV